MTAQPTASPDPAAHQEFVSRYEGPLRSYFAKRVNRYEDIDDLVQEVFRRVWASVQEAEIANPDGYIFQAAANLLKERYRKQSTSEAAIADLPFFQRRAEDITPERILQGKRELLLLEQALAELPARIGQIEEAIEL